MLAESCEASELTSTRDVLNRHHAAHHGPNANDYRSGQSFRACVPCATARVKCMGSQPCHRCSTKMIECSYPDARSRKRSLHLDSEELPVDRDMSTSHNDNSSSGGPAGGDVHQSQAWSGMDSMVITATATNTQINQTDEHQPINYGTNEQLFSAQSLTTSNQACSGTYGIPEQLPISMTRGPGYELPSDNFGSTRYPTVTPYDFSLLSNQSIEQPQLGDYGYSAINWLSPKDLGYSEFNYESQFLDVNDFNFWTEPTAPIVSEQSLNFGADTTMNENVGHHDRSRSDGIPQILTPAPDVHTASPSTSNYESPRTASTPSRSSNYYVDGAGAREPRYGRLRKQGLDWEGSDGKPHPVLDQDTCKESGISFPPSIEQYLNGHVGSSRPGLSQETYQKLFTEFQGSCIGTVHSFSSNHFPSFGVLNLAKHLYFEYFHPTYPLLHKISARDKPQSWLIDLAVCAVGINYIGTRDSRQCSEAFIEFLERCFQNSGTSDKTFNNNLTSNTESEDLVKTQARVLCCVVMFHSRDTSLVERAFIIRSQLVGECLRRRMLSTVPKTQISEDQVLSTRWEQFIMEESKVRAGYCIFVKNP